MSKLKGIDISVHQGNVDFNKVKSDGIQFLILRSGFAKTVDRMFHTYVKGAKAAGIPIYGVYHFSYALNTEQAEQEADFCISELEKAGLGKDTIIFFDLEYDSVTYAKSNNVIIGKTKCSAFTRAFCQRVTEKGYKAGVYSNIDYYRNMFEHDLFSKYVFWLADWSGDADYKCDFHQYTSKGSVSGIKGNVDMNYCLMNLMNMNKTEPTDTAKKSIDEVAKDVISGKYGNGDVRKEKLKAEGYDPTEVQARVNELLAKGTTAAPPKKSTDDIVKDVFNGKYGNGDERKKKLKVEGYNPDEVQARVNEYIKVAKDVISGKYGNGDIRKGTLKAKGYDPVTVQTIVNQIMP